MVSSVCVCDIGRVVTSNQVPTAIVHRFMSSIAAAPDVARNLGDAAITNALTFASAWMSGAAVYAGPTSCTTAPYFLPVDFPFRLYACYPPHCDR